MKIQPYATLFALSLLAPGVAARPFGGSGAKPVSTEVAALRAHCDASLESLRAGRIEPPTLLGAEDRAGLRAAESRSTDLEEMRAGELTDHEWTMIAVGALIVLIIVIIA
jgi:hypothetical protein